ncbi:glycosyltransferase family 8 protein [Campylobacter sp. MIT 19-121]|uniref:glycosyltransferase family 8 protein n=1 Tax=Campylobacter sp. MIT 19-121 TaxID=2703906 RepID=UPI00138A2BEE|nr:glycosyltransferase family 8 protein [Campylobacter sp. MIT 19-121]NDJ28030.1 glycosyltransferase family 8 protein [Campylobacter sp. MIT 19-121]
MFHIVFNLNDNYVKYVAVLITSIIKNTNSLKKIKDFFNETATNKINFKQLGYQSLHECEEGYVFHLLTDGIKNENKIKLEKFEAELNTIYPCKIKIYTLDDTFLKIYSLPKIQGSHLAYFKLRMASSLPNEISKCLYLDVDMLAVSDIREIFTLDLCNKIIAAVGCFRQYPPLKAKIKHLDDFKLEPFHFNTGFMFIDLDLWRKEKIEERCFEFMAKFHLNHLGDECAINAITATNNRYLTIPLRWNLTFGTANIDNNSFNDIPKPEKNAHYDMTKLDFEHELENPRIIHFTGGGDFPNPWGSLYKTLNYNSLIPLHYQYRKKWWEIALETPIFCDELQNIKKNLKENQLNDLRQLLQLRFRDINIKAAQLQNSIIQFSKQKNTSNIGAVYKIKNQLSYKLGEIMIKNSKNLMQILQLPFKIKQISREHKEKQNIYNTLIELKPELKLQNIETYPDYKEALKLKEQLPYKLGEAFIKAYNNRWGGGDCQILFYRYA